MKHKKLIFFVASAILSFGILTPLMMREGKGLEPDNVVYDDPAIIDFDNPEEIYEPAPIKRAAETAVSGIVIHYHNDDGKCIPDSEKGYVGREFWIWASNINGSAYQVDAGGTPTDITLTLPFTGDHADFAKEEGLSFIAKHKGAENWDGKSDNTAVLFEDFTPKDNGMIEIWVIPGEGSALEVYATQEETQMDRFLSANFVDWKTIEVIGTAKPTFYRLYALTSSYMSYNAYMKEQLLPNYLIAQGDNPSCNTVNINPDPDSDPVWAYKFTITLNHTIRPNIQYYLNGSFPEWTQYVKTKYVASHNLYSTPRFTTYYNYSGEDLGATYNGDSTTFKVWAPTAARVRLKLFKSGTSTAYDDPDNNIVGNDSARYYSMAFRPGGVWELTITGEDLTETYPYYNYQVFNSLGTNTVMDPYAKGCGINGERAMVVDWSKTNPDDWNNLPVKWDGETAKGLDITAPNQLSIYETHIRDLTMHSSWTGSSKRGTFNAFVEPNTRVSGSSVTTGFDHLKELGMDAIQLVPVFDHDNSEVPSKVHYNWGYNPLNYNCVEGSYSSDPYDGYARIKEFKNLIYTFANTPAKTRIIMDVVYNHVNSASDSCFNLIMPRYYFRMTENGEYYNGSGCGNEVKSEAPMMRKFIVDSLKFWATEYKIKGFRFDLMGLIDVGTIDLARRELFKVDPDIFIYGEGWTGDGSGYSYDGDYAGSAWQVHGNQDMHDGTNNADGKLITTNEQRALLGCVRSSVYRYLYPIPNTCVVGMFNDNGRNALKGENELNDAKGWGYIDQDSSVVGGKSSVIADMMIGYHTGYGGNPAQCVNYASCHDNFALFDQLNWAIARAGSTDVGQVCAATMACECAMMFSNGAAFIRGGEEVFHTKIIKPGSDDDELAVPSKYTMVTGVDGVTHKISHDSYNLSDDVNAFDWTRKVSIGTKSTIGYFNELKAAIALRKQLPKYSYDYLQTHNPRSSTSVFNTWGEGDGSTTIAVKNGNYFFFLSGCNDNVVPFSAYYSGVNHIDFSTSRSGDYKGFIPDGSTGLTIGWYTGLCLH